MKHASSKQYSARIPLTIAEEIDAFYSGRKIADVIREAIIEKFERDSGLSIDKSLIEMSQGSRTDLPNRVTEAEKRARKGLRPRGRPRKSELVAIENLEKRARKEFAALARAFGKTSAEAKALADAAVPRGKAVREARKPAAAPAQAPRSRRAA